MAHWEDGARRGRKRGLLASALSLVALLVLSPASVTALRCGVPTLLSPPGPYPVTRSGISAPSAPVLRNGHLCLSAADAPQGPEAGP